MCYPSLCIPPPFRIVLLFCLVPASPLCQKSVAANHCTIDLCALLFSVDSQPFHFLQVPHSWKIYRGVYPVTTINHTSVQPHALLFSRPSALRSPKSISAQIMYGRSTAAPQLARASTPPRSVSSLALRFISYRFFCFRM